MPVCPYCTSTDSHKRGKSLLTGEQIYVCKQCHRKYRLTSIVRPKHTSIDHPCLNCGKLTMNPKFCCSSCSATYTNKAYQKRKPKPRLCKHCGEPISGRRTTCVECNPNLMNWMGRTLGELQHRAKYQVSAHLRTIARNVYDKAALPRTCANCGYDKHVEICHVRAINSFPDDTPIATINDLMNLVALCPNCHWELDHGLLQISPRALGNSPKDR